MNYKLTKLFLRIALATAFFSAVADRFGIWSKDISVWGNWTSFVEYTKLLNPWFPASTISFLAIIATTAEIVFAICLLIGFKTELFAKLSGILLFIFAISMTFSTGIKGAFDYSVFSASAAAFALASIKTKFIEIDSLIQQENQGV